MSSSRRSLALAGLIVLTNAGAAGAQSCVHPTPLMTVCRYVVSTPEALNAEAVGRVRRTGPGAHADLSLIIDGRPCGSGAVSSGLFGSSAAHARCVLKPELHGRRLSPMHMAEAVFTNVSDAEPVSLDISLDHHGGLLTLPLEEKALAPKASRRK